jgi:hypothetical protein
LKTPLAIQPLDADILSQCYDIIEKNHKTKGDSWLTTPIENAMPDLIMKLTEEFSECIIQLNSCCDPYDADLTKKELCDLINVAAMLHQRLRALK